MLSAGPGAHALATAFGHSLQAALAVNIGLILAALALAVFGPGPDAPTPRPAASTLGQDAAGPATADPRIPAARE